MNLKILLFTSISALTILTPSLFAQVKVGDNPTTINSNAALEIESTNKGVRLPRLPLTATNVASPLSAHVQGMMVYNTATAGPAPFNVMPGIYYNDGTKWLKLDTIDGTFTFLTASNPTAVTSAPPFYDFRFQDESNDVLNEYNPATGIYTAARTGIYTITLCELGTCPSGPYAGVSFLNINGTQYAGSSYHVASAGGGNFSSILSISVPLNAGDNIYPRMWSSPAGISGCSLTNVAGRTFMTVMRIR